MSLSSLSINKFKCLSNEKKYWRRGGSQIRGSLQNSWQSTSRTAQMVLVHLCRTPAGICSDKYGHSVYNVTFFS